MTKNAHLTEYLSYYCDREGRPEYAVLVKGEWGTGKTYIIKNFIQNHTKEDQRFLYVSLYGINSMSQINDELFRQLHPILGSKAASYAGKFFKGAIKATIKVDLDGDGKDDGSLALAIPDAGLSKDLTDENIVLVFDDLERCSIQVNDVLGYINHYVEQVGNKVIIIANESEIIRLTKDKEQQYFTIREKVIGHSIEVVSDFEAALTYFISKISNDKARAYLEGSVELVKSTYVNSEIKNLRVLRQVLWDFERLFASLPEKALEIKELSDYIFSVFSSLSLEFKSGSINPGFVQDFMGSYRSAIFSKGKEKDSPASVVRRKYIDVDFNDKTIRPEIWADIIERGRIDTAHLSQSLDASRYFQTYDPPEWRVLWEMRRLDDEEFEAALARTLEKFDSLEYKVEGELLHVAGMLLWLSKEAIIERSPEEIIKHTRHTIESLVNQNTLVEREQSMPRSLDMGYGGLAFHSDKDREFHALKEYIEECKNHRLENQFGEICAGLMSNMKEDTEEFLRKITLTADRTGEYYRVPVFTALSPSKFVEEFLTLNAQRQHKAAMALNIRYTHGNNWTDLAAERPWISQVIESMRAAKSDGNSLSKLAKVRLGDILQEYLVPAQRHGGIVETTPIEFDDPDS